MPRLRETVALRLCSRLSLTDSSSRAISVAFLEHAPPPRFSTVDFLRIPGHRLPLRHGRVTGRCGRNGLRRVYSWASGNIFSGVLGSQYICHKLEGFALSLGKAAR